jgi:hypothetical protein
MRIQSRTEAQASRGLALSPTTTDVKARAWGQTSVTEKGAGMPRRDPWPRQAMLGDSQCPQRLAGRYYAT